MTKNNNNDNNLHVEMAAAEKLYWRGQEEHEKVLQREPFGDKRHRILLIHREHEIHHQYLVRKGIWLS